MSAHTLVRCTHDQHAAAILDIFNDAILHSTALYEYAVRTPATMTAWFKAKGDGGFPVIGVEDGLLPHQRAVVTVTSHEEFAMHDVLRAIWYGVLPQLGS